MRSDVERIIELFGPREVIGQAIDALMNADDVSRDAAFELLIRFPCSLSEIAGEILQQRRGA